MLHHCVVVVVVVVAVAAVVVVVVEFCTLSGCSFGRRSHMDGIRPESQKPSQLLSLREAWMRGPSRRPGQLYQSRAPNF